MKLGGEPIKQKRTATQSKKEQPTMQKTKESHSPRRQKDIFSAKKQKVENTDDEINDEEEISEEEVKIHSNKKVIATVIAAIVVAIIIIAIILFLVLKPKNKVEPSNNIQSQVTQEQNQQQINNTDMDTQTDSTDNQNLNSQPVDDTSLTDSLGIQDFTGNTNMTTSDTLDNIDEDLEDLFGLSLRVDYTVSKIENITDFVNYQKKRGTWGNGLEIYYLDATYKGAKYFIQVPYKYYKELDDTGIVPVNMEVLRINSNTGTSDDERVVISYMKLDSKTLESVKKNK